VKRNRVFVFPLKLGPYLRNALIGPMPIIETTQTSNRESTEFIRVASSQASRALNTMNGRYHIITWLNKLLLITDNETHAKI
jgi:hypothetical protein